jgi:hypothetical protein
MPFKKGKSGNDAAKFKPGQTGNPNGRPKGKTITERLRDLLEEHPDRADKIVEAGVQAAEGGDFQFWKYLCDRTEGTPAQTINANIEATVNIVRVQNGERQFKR